MISRLLSDAAASDPAAPFLIDRGRIWSRGESLDAVRTLAAALRQAGHRRLVAYLEDSADLVHLLLAAADLSDEVLPAVTDPFGPAGRPRGEDHDGCVRLRPIDGAG